MPPSDLKWCFLIERFPYQPLVEVKLFQITGGVWATQNSFWNADIWYSLWANTWTSLIARPCLQGVQGVQGCLVLAHYQIPAKKRAVLSFMTCLCVMVEDSFRGLQLQHLSGGLANKSHDMIIHLHKQIQKMCHYKNTPYNPLKTSDIQGHLGCQFPSSNQHLLPSRSFPSKLLPVSFHFSPPPQKNDIIKLKHILILWSKQTWMFCQGAKVRDQAEGANTLPEMTSKFEAGQTFETKMIHSRGFTQAKPLNMRWCQLRWLINCTNVGNDYSITMSCQICPS